jgi:hypothetical protein
VANNLESSRQASRMCSRVEDPDCVVTIIRSVANVDIRERAYANIVETDPDNGEIFPEDHRLREPQSSPAERMILSKTSVSVWRDAGHVSNLFHVRLVRQYAVVRIPPR